MRRVVITGIGVVSPLGNNAIDFWDGISNGRSGIREILRADMSAIRFKNGGELRNFDATQHFDEKSLMWLDEFGIYGIVAAREALADSGVEFSDELKEKTGVVTGSCLGGKTTEDDHYYRYYVEGKVRQQPTVIPRAMSNAVASQVAMEQGFTGANFTLSTACSSANHAIGHAFWLVRQGTLDVAVTGGSEAPLCWGNLKAWEAMRVVSPDTCRPFAKDRNGMILGEGGAMFVIESLENARKRGAKIYAELAGFGMSADAHHLTMPLSTGAAKAIRMAIEDGGINKEEVGYVNAHGTATPANDSMEANAIGLVFGEHTKNIGVSSTKSMVGHSLGAAGAIEAAATVLGLCRGVLPPNINFTEIDPECRIDVIANTAREKTVNAAISNSFAFGGLNAVLAFRRWQG